MNCPKCQKGLLPAKDGGGFCASCGELFPKEQIGVLSETESVLSAKKFPLDLGKIPSFLAIPADEYLKENHPVMRLHRMCDATDMLTRFLAICGLAEIRRSAGKKPFSDNLLEILRSNIENPTWDKWAELIEEITDTIENTQNIVLKELPGFVKNHLIPFLGTGGNKPREALLRLKNDLTGAGPMPRASAKAFLEIYESRFSDLWSQASFLSDSKLLYNGESISGLLTGPGVILKLYQPEPELEKKTDALKGHVIMIHKGEILDLSPLCCYGRAESHSPARQRKAKSKSPLIYARSEPDRLIFSAPGADLPLGESSDAVSEFSSLFFQDSQVSDEKVMSLDFESEFRREADKLIGRADEIRKATLAIKTVQTGVLWLSGPGGIGKSAFMAKLALDLDDPERICMVAYFFKEGDARCSKEKFLRSATDRISRWTEEYVCPEHDPVRLERQFDALLEKVSALEPAHPRARARRILFIIDGMDEILRHNPEFAEFPFQKSHANVVWVCAGSPGLADIFREERCTLLVGPEGLPKMNENDIRMMLLERTGGLKYELLARDKENDNSKSKTRVTNDFVSEVVKKADGLPLYMKFVTKDILSGDLSFYDEKLLPEGLHKYYDVLIRRLSHGGFQAVLKPLLVCIAQAKEPLCKDVLNTLLVRRQVLSKDEKPGDLLGTALRQAGGMLKRAPTSQGISGYTLCHDTLRKHVRESGELSDQNQLTAKMFEDFVLDWKELPEGPSRMYALRHGPDHLTEAGEWDRLEALLTDLHFTEARCAAGMIYDIIRDYARAMDALPEAREKKQGRSGWEMQVRKYTRDLTALSKGEIQTLEIIQSVKLRTREDIRRNAERIISNPTRFDRIQAFSQFVNTECHNLVKFGNHPDFIFQHAYNFAGSGPLADIAEFVVNKTEDKIFLLHHPLQRTGCNPGLLKPLEGHMNRVSGVSVTPDGKTAVSASWDKTVRVWDLEAGLCMKTLRGHTEFIGSVRVTPDGKTAVSGGEDNTLRVWDTETGQCLQILKGHTSYVESVSVSPDGKTAISASKDNTLCVWDTETGQCVRILEGHSWDYSTSPHRVRHMGIFKKRKNITSISMTPDKKIAVSGSDDKTLRVWDTETGQCLKALEGHIWPVDCVDVTPDGKTAISGSYGKTIRVWDLETGQCVKTLEGHEGPVYSVSMTPDGKIAVSGNEDKTVRVWNLETGECIMTLKGHTGPVYSVSVTPDGKTAVSGSWDNTIRMWNLENMECQGHAEAHAWDVVSVSVTSNGKTAVSGSHDKTLRVWDVETGRSLKTFEGHTDFVESVSIAPDGKTVVSGSDDKTLRVWDMKTGQCLKTLEGHTSFVETVVVRPDGKTAISAGYDDTFRIWDLETGSCLKIYEIYTRLIKNVSVTPDGKAAILASSDNVLCVWNLKTGQCVNTLMGHTRDVTDASITPDGKTVVSASYDKTLRVWELETGECVNILEGHTGSVSSVSVTPDGKFAVSAGADHTIRVWDIINGESVCVYLARNNLLCLSEIGTDLCFAYGTAGGEVIFPIFRNFHMKDIPATTSSRIWLFGEKDKPGKWENDIKAHCWWCGRRFPVSDKILSIITDISRNASLFPGQSPCLRLPREVWDSSGLRSECRFCHKPLKFNPFIVDNSEEPDLPEGDEVYTRRYLNNMSYGLSETLGGYEIIKPLGRTSMGMIYFARDMLSDRITAIKTLRIPETLEPGEAENLKMKFFRESESAGTLSHPNIVSIYGAGMEQGVAYIVMEFLDGGDLSKYTKKNNLLPMDKVTDYVADIAGALDYMHQQGIVHRDIKPSNIMLLNTDKVKIADFGTADAPDRPDKVKITDFGVARIISVSKTEDGVVKGTPQYMSPEQISGEKVDGRSDIFSLGIMLYQLLTGKLPFQGNNPETLGHEITNSPHPDPKEINPNLLKSHEFIINKALEKDREKRYQKGNEMASHLRALKVLIED